MIEHVQTTSNGISLLAGKGKTGAAGVFANLFKALGHKSISGKTLLKAGHAAAPQDKATALAEAATMLQADSLQGLKAQKAQKAKGGAGEHSKKADSKQDKSAKTAHDKTHGKQQAESQAPVVAIEVPHQQPAAADNGKQGTDRELLAKSDKPAVARPTTSSGEHETTDPAGAQAGNKTARSNTRAAQPSIDSETAQAGMQRAAAPKAVHAGTQQPIAPTAEPRHADAATRAAPASHTTADKPQDATPRPAAARPMHQPAVAQAANVAHDSIRAGASRGTPSKVSHTVRQTAAQPAQVAEQADLTATHVSRQQAVQQQMMSDAMQRDADAMQQIKDAIASIAVKGKQQSVQDGAADGDAQASGLSAPHAATSHLRHATLAQASQTTATQLAQAAGSNLANGAGNQGNGHPSGGDRHDTADARVFSAAQADSRPQHHFNVQPQAATRMPQPMRPLEAMQTIAQSVSGGNTRIELQLEPAHLGKVHVSLQTDPSKQLQMHLTVEHAMTRQVIEQHLPQLRAALEQQGLNLGNFSLHTGSGQQQQQQQAFEHAAGFSQDATVSPADATPPAGMAAASESVTSRLSIHI